MVHDILLFFTIKWSIFLYELKIENIWNLLKTLAITLADLKKKNSDIIIKK